MRCHNCGFESEDNFCKICGIEIIEEQNEIIHKPISETAYNFTEYTEPVPTKKMSAPKKIILSTLAILAGIAVVSSASIGIFVLTTKTEMEDKLYYHTINQKVNCGDYSIALTNISAPKGIAKKVDYEYYYDDNGYSYSLNEIEELQLDIKDLRKESDTTYSTVIAYDVEFTLYNNTNEYEYIDIFFINENMQTEYGEDTFNNGSYDFYTELRSNEDLSEASFSDEGYLELKPRSKFKISAQLLLYSQAESYYYYKDYEFKKYDSAFDDYTSLLYYNPYDYYSSSSVTYPSISHFDSYDIDISTNDNMFFAVIEDYSDINLPTEYYVTICLEEKGASSTQKPKFFLNPPMPK